MSTKHNKLFAGSFCWTIYLCQRQTFIANMAQVMPRADVRSYLIRRKTEQRAKAEVSEAGLERRWRQKAASALTIM